MLPVRIILFNAVQLGACLYAFRRGGAPERWTAALMVLAAIATAALPRSAFDAVDPGQALVDAALLAGLVALAARANRFWPLWLAALQLVAVSVHGVRAADATILPAVYNQTIGKLAYAMIAVLVIGTRRHHRRAAAHGGDPDWSPLR